MDFSNVKVGDIVQRDMCGILMDMNVTATTDALIICGGDETDHMGWWFDKKTGAEVDEELGWGPAFGRSGSFLTGVIESNENTGPTR